MRLTITLVVIILIGQSNGLITKSTRDFNKIIRRPPIPKPQSDHAVILEYIDQRVDNFNPQNSETYKMRFYRNDEHFKTQGPILIEVGGEWTIEADSLRGGLMFDLARELNAQMFNTEHRYYGKSLPTPNASTSNLRYLSIDQALADLAHFIAHVKKEPGRENSKVVLFGCSYAGTMVTWFRQKYPHLAVGAKASSAPLLAKSDFVEYKEVVGSVVRYVGSEACYTRLQNAFHEADELASTKEGFNELKKMFNICDTFDNDDKMNVWSFFGTLASGLDILVQTSYIEEECQDLLKPQNVTDLEAFVRYFLNCELNELCSNDYCRDISYDDTVEFYRNVEWTDDSTLTELRQWTYQLCTEFGFFITSGLPYQPFGSYFPVEFNYQECADFYDEKIFNEQTINNFINRKNAIYGAQNPAIKNVYFTHGRFDPWRPLGILYDYNEYSPADVVLNEAHCFDEESISNEDSAEVVAVKKRIKQFVHNLLT